MTLGVPIRDDSSPSLDLDPRLLMLAQEAVRDLVSEVGRSVIEGRQEALTLRLAKAFQMCLEQEYNALVQELTT